MAEEEIANEENQDTEEEKSGKKGIIIIVVIAIVAIALSVAATMFFLGGDDSTESLEQETEEAEAPAEIVPAIYMDIRPPFLVTFNVGGRQRYMQIYLSVSSRDQSSLDTVNYHMPLIRSRLITAYSGQRFEDLQTNEGKISLQSQTLDIVNEVLTSEGAESIEGVYFTNFVLQ